MGLVIYFLVAAGLTVYNIIDDSHLPIMLMAIFIFLSIVLLIICIVLRVCITVKFNDENLIAHCGEDTSFSITITNKSIFPLSFGRAVFIAKDTNMGRIKHFTKDGELICYCPPRKSVTYEQHMTLKNCGTKWIRMKRFYVYDFFRVFRLPISHKNILQILVLPKKINQVLEEKITIGVEDENNVIYSDKKPGDDNTELFAIKEYTPGDKVRNIHWKLSSKVGKLMVKENGLPINNNDTIVVDVFKLRRSRKNRRRLNDMYEYLIGLICSMLARGEGLNVCYYNGEYRYMRIENENDINSFMNELYSSRMNKDYKNVSAAKIFFAQTDKGYKGKIFYITPEKNEQVENYLKVLDELAPTYYLYPGVELLEDKLPVKYVEYTI